MDNGVFTRLVTVLLLSVLLSSASLFGLRSHDQRVSPGLDSGIEVLQDDLGPKDGG